MIPILFWKETSSTATEVYALGATIDYILPKNNLTELAELRDFVTTKIRNTNARKRATYDEVIERANVMWLSKKDNANLGYDLEKNLFGSKKEFKVSSYFK
nr:unnamed protein product [Naegleria fowleri]